MKLFTLVLSSLVCGVTAQWGNNNTAPVDVEPLVETDTTPVEYTHNGTALLGHLAVPDGEGPFPAVIIIPDWDGVNVYEQARATMIAEDWGFVGFAADIFGADLQFVESFADRGTLVTEYRSNHELFIGRINAAIELVKALDVVDEESVVLFGYCFGGTGVLQYGLYGNNDVKAIASFHGGLSDLPEVPQPFGPKLLVQSGGDDDTSTRIMDLEKTLDLAEAHWEITRYSGVNHGFTVFDGAAYNEWADMRSWETAYNFVLEALGIMAFEAFEFNEIQPEATSVVAVDYTGSDWMPLRGYLAMPEGKWERPLPAVVIIPDWDGVNAYEKDRAAALAELGYVAFAADIYGADKQEGLEFDERVELSTLYNSDPDLFIARMQSAIDQVKMLASDVAMDEIAIIGYCFGGSGVVLYSLQSGVDAKVAVAFHGGLANIPEVLVTAIEPYLLVLSGGDDMAHGNQTVMEEAFNGGEANWEITRYAGVQHGYTVPGQDAYNLNADARSWESMLSSFEELMAVPQIVDSTPTSIGVPTSSTPSAAPITEGTDSLAPSPLDEETTLAPTSQDEGSDSGASSRSGYFVAFAIAAAASVIA